jgi:hypothetical protein
MIDVDKNRVLSTSLGLVQIDPPTYEERSIRTHRYGRVRSSSH